MKNEIFLKNPMENDEGEEVEKAILVHEINGVATVILDGDTEETDIPMSKIVISEEISNDDDESDNICADESRCPGDCDECDKNCNDDIDDDDIDDYYSGGECTGDCDECDDHDCDARCDDEGCDKDYEEEDL